MKRNYLATLIALFPALSLAQPPAGAPPASRADNFINTLDANKDGKVDQKEFLKPFEMQFQMMDANKDGYLEKSEIEAMEQKMRERRRQMEQMRQQQGQGKR